ncbi:hypothetical protein [Spiroplasma endosymbiont of Dilophus febrilis]|uniref:hypothetical protein n=1 Tax=Spiroplasma endosymbiont of Dilophus febrilis TaxID=3066292 RepID=UPI00313B612C
MLFFQNYSNLYPPNKTLCALLILNSQALFGNANPHQAIIVIGIVASICFILTISIPIYFYIWAMQPVYKFA